ncbi:MAG: hypothetical protein ABW318_20710 [Vicinamibacterales bacterium]
MRAAPTAKCVDTAAEQIRSAPLIDEAIDGHDVPQLARGGFQLRGEFIGALAVIVHDSG